MTRLLARDWKFKIIILAFFTLAINTVEAQHECRSALGAHFKPISENLPINWATEIVLMPGAMSDRFIFNGMAIAGLEYYSKSLKHQFYFEGEYKYWYNSNRGPGMAGTGTGYVSFNQPEKLHFGFRELFYSYNGSFKIKAGIQSMKSAKSFLLDEGVFGISAKKKLGNLQVNLKGGTVYGAIAKMQDICGTRHLYNLVRGNKVNFVGENLLESNFILAELNWSPGSKTELAKGNFNEFESTDEFSDFNEFSSEEKATKAFSFKNATFRFYEEFGEIFPDYKFYGGATFEFELFEKLGLDAEILTQWMNENKALIYKFRVNREKFWSNGALSVLEAKYLGLKNIDDDVQHLPSFSNLFMGELMRLDMMHLPLIELSASHRFPDKFNTEIELDYIHQFKDAKTREIDLIYSLKPWKNIHLNFVGAYVDSDLMEKSNFLVRLEARILL